MKKIFAPFQMPSIKKCVAVGCNTDQDSKITLFSIPRPLPESWRKFLSVSDLNSKTKLCEKVVCLTDFVIKNVFMKLVSIILRAHIVGPTRNGYGKKCRS